MGMFDHHCQIATMFGASTLHLVDVGKVPIPGLIELIGFMGLICSQSREQYYPKNCQKGLAS